MAEENLEIHSKKNKKLTKTEYTGSKKANLPKKVGFLLRNQ